jgi:hypothetical protein
MTTATRRVTIVGLVGLVLLGIAGDWLESPGTLTQHQKTSTITTPKPVLRTRYATNRYAWSFERGLPRQWISRVPISISHGRTMITTNTSAGYQLYSAPLKLPAGAYEYRASFRMTNGGLAIGILNVSLQRFVQSGEYSAKDDGDRPLTVSGRFTLMSPSVVAVVLSNAARGVRSTWALRRASLLRTGA